MSGLVVGKRRFGVHLLRDAKDLREMHPDDPRLAEWAERLNALYRQARDFTSPDRRTRVAARASSQTWRAPEHNTIGVCGTMLAQRG